MNTFNFFYTLFNTFQKVSFNNTFLGLYFAYNILKFSIFFIFHFMLVEERYVVYNIHCVRYSKFYYNHIYGE